MRLVVLYGPPGVGKLTVGTELSELTGFKLFHNHLTVNLVTSVFTPGSEASNRLAARIRLDSEPANFGVLIQLEIDRRTGPSGHFVEEQWHRRILPVRGQVDLRKLPPLRRYDRDLFLQLPNERLLRALAWLTVTTGYIPEVRVGHAGFRAPTQQDMWHPVAPHQQTTDDEGLHWVI